MKKLTEEQIQLIRELSEQGNTVETIAEQLGIGKRTVARYKVKTPAPTAESDKGAEVNNHQEHYTTDETDLSSECEEFGIEGEEKDKARHFAFVVYPSEEWIKANCPECDYDGADGWGTAPDDWIELLKRTGLSFVVSPLHWKDKNPTGTHKKPHWHVIISWDNNTTYRHASTMLQKMLSCPKPLILKKVTGMFRYLTHKDNPEKAQYSENDLQFVNGWSVPLDEADVEQIKHEIRLMIYTRDCQEYGELVSECASVSKEHEEVVSKHTMYFNALCRSFRHCPIRSLSRVFNELTDDPETQAQIAEVMKLYGENTDKEENANESNS